ncbi:hypothetical protein OPV22_032191 [Ensete ventricosum]|uniref:Uncharacterized protein n=1 Tax=Ensete ventricosum TaxID=4639 RepID=A0AAV8P118_ENSVE|nr:hypothetical protein OPV22_032191 [Ensete ventricosum]
MGPAVHGSRSLESTLRRGSSNVTRHLYCPIPSGFVLLLCNILMSLSRTQVAKRGLRQVLLVLGHRVVEELLRSALPGGGVAVWHFFEAKNKRIIVGCLLHFNVIV